MTNEKYDFGIGESINLLLIFIPAYIIIIIVFKLFHIDKNLFFSGIQQLIAYSFIIVIALKRMNNKFTDMITFKRINLFLICMLLLTTVGLHMILFKFADVLLCLIPPPDYIIEMYKSISPSNKWDEIFTIVIIAPIMEEFLYRGVLLRGFLQKYSIEKSILISALIFALIHANPWQFMPALVMGIFLGWIFVNTRSIIICILIHSLYNGLSMIIGTTFTFLHVILGVCISIIGLLYVKRHFKSINSMGLS